jgi:hypothetical protein
VGTIDEPDRAPDRVAIEALKHAYFRLLDTKRFEELGELLTEDVVTAYDSGRLAHRGRRAVVAFLEASLGDPGVVTMHTGHHPEIVFASDDVASASGTWYLEDRVIVAAADFELHGTALYHDEYRRQGGHWRISATGYDRIFEEHRRWSSGELLSSRTMFDPAGGVGPSPAGGVGPSCPAE